MLAVQAELEQNHAVFRKLLGTTLKNQFGAVVYTPLQDPAQVVALMTDLERFIDDDGAFDAELPARWQEWVLYMLDAVETTAQQTIRTVTDIKAALLDTKHRIRAGFKFYSQDLINNLFMHPFTKIEFVERDLKVSRLTATKYLDALAQAGFVKKMKVGRSNYYVNLALNEILIRNSAEGTAAGA